MKEQEVIVSICCVTYNHENYIRQCLDGFVMQKTDFKFEILVHEDASTDNTASIVREYENKYPDLFRCVYQTENQFLIQNTLTNILFPMSKGKYIALCEGDDYWIDPHKLQKQVDFLEANDDYGMVHSELSHYYVKSGKMVERYWKSSGVTNQEGDIYRDLLLGNKSMVYFCTACFRAGFVKNNQQFDLIMQQNYPMGDVPLALHIAYQSKIAYLKYPTAVRRVLSFSATQGQSFEYWFSWWKKTENLFDFFNAIRPIDNLELKTLYYKNRIVKMINLSYQYYKEEIFIEYYNKLTEKKNVSLELRIKKIGMHNKYSYKLSKVILKVLRKLKVV